MAFYNSQNEPVSNFGLHLLHGNDADALSVYAKAYTLAANELARLLLDANRFAEYEAYPVIMLYRHALELHLKNAIHMSILTLALRERDDVDERLKATHDLRRLSELTISLLGKLNPDDLSLKEFGDELAKTCKEFMEIAPTVDYFRYPIDHSLKPLLKEQSIFVNLRSIYTHMVSMLEQCEVLAFGLNVTVDEAIDEYEIRRTIEHFLQEATP